MNLDADDPYEILGTTPDATETEVKVAAAKAKRELNPDHFPDEEKKTARQRLYRVREAERAILEGREMDPTAGEQSSGPTTAEQSGGPTASASTAGDLSVETDTDRPSVGTPVSVHVMDPEGQPVSDARVVTDPIDQPPDGESGDAGQTARTDGNGVATLVFDTAGRRRVVATADADATAGDDGGDGREFRPGETSIVVTRPTVSLSLAVDSETVTAGSSVSFRVLDDEREPVRDASVAVAGQTLSTDASGVTSTELHGSGTVRVRATKTEPGVRYNPATATVRVTSPGSLDLVVADDRERDHGGRLRVESDETVTFVVRSVETDQPVGDATLTVAYAGSADRGSDGPEAGSPTTETVETTDDGRASVTFTEPGRASVEATHSDSASDTVEVVVRRSDAGWEAETEADSDIGVLDGGRLAARAVGLLVVVALSGLIGSVVVSDGLPVVLVGGGGVVVALGLVVYLRLVAR